MFEQRLINGMKNFNQLIHVLLALALGVAMRHGHLGLWLKSDRGLECGECSDTQKIAEGKQ